MAKGAVQIGTDADVAAIAGQLADMINVVHDAFEFQVHFFRRGLGLDPARHHHPRIQHSPDHRSSFDEIFDLFIRELAVMRDEGATIRMAGPETTMKMVERFPKTLVA